MDEKKETKETDKEAEKTSKPDERPLSMLDETKKVRDETKALLVEYRAENDRRERLQSESMLGGVTDGRVEPVKVVQTAQDYAKDVMSGKVGNVEKE